MTKEPGASNLGLALSAYMQKHDVTGKELAKAIGIGESTLTRIRQGLSPDAAGFVKIMAWLARVG